MAIKELTKLKKDYATEKPIIESVIQLANFELELTETDNIIMSEPKTKEKEISERLDAFFKKICPVDDFAKILRAYRHETLNLALITDDVDYEKGRVVEGAYYINEFCEIISPYFINESMIKQRLDI